MNGNSNSDNSPSLLPTNDDDREEIYWIKLYLLLRPFVMRWVYSSFVSVWLGQEEDVVNDIMQETMLRLFIYQKRAEKGEVTVVKSPEHMIAVIAHNCCRDWQRRDGRLVRITTTYNSISLEHLIKSSVVDPAEIAQDFVFYSWLFERLSELVVNMPDKQRVALLRDISGRMYFGQIPTSLQKAFADKGLDLKQHQDWKSADKREQSQHASNLSLSYKRIEGWSKEAVRL